MSLDGRVSKLEQAAGVGGDPCGKCGQSGAAFGGRDREEALREAEREAVKDPHVVDARATAFNCPACGRPRVLVIQHVDNWGERASA